MGVGQGMAAPGTGAWELGMTPDRWRQIKDVFDAVLEKTPPERTEFLESSCAGDVELRREVESLIAAYGDAGSRYEKPAVQSDSMIDRQIGAYRILRRLGSGGMGAIYLAARADDQFRRLVAVKAIRPELLDDHTRRRFENERHTLAALEHPNIVKLLDGGTTDDGIPYLVMDYVEGQPIDRFCRDRGLSIRERLALFRILCGAVHFAHQNLVVHRDLKPANILVTPQAVPKLLDFGIAKLLRPAYAAATVGMTRTVAQPMTPEYASPEQILGQPITTASDIYSLGVLMYILLAGVHPFEGQTSSTLALEQAVCEGRTRKPSEAAPADMARQLRGDLDTIVLSAMRKEPQRRYASAEHLSEDVRRYLEDEPVLARGDTILYRARKFVGRHRPAVTASTVAIAALIFLGVSEHQDRLRAERRFSDLRELSNWVIGDLDKAMHDGQTEARKTVVAKALTYLDGLGREAGNDPALQREVVGGYAKVATLQGALFAANTGEPDAALETLKKASPIADALARRDSRNPETRKTLLQFHEALARNMGTAGDAAGVVEHYRKALEFTDADRHEAISLWSELAHIQGDLGDPSAALESFRHCEQLVSEWQRGHPDDEHIPQMLAFARERIAWFIMLAGEPASNAEAPVRAAIAAYVKRVAQKPSSKVARFNLAKAYEILAEVLKREGKTSDALDACRQSRSMVERLRTEDATDSEYPISLADSAVLLVDLLASNGQAAEARSEAARTLGGLRAPAHAANPIPRLLDPYLRLLLDTSDPELAKTDDPLPLALRVVELSGGKDADSLLLLAKAYRRAGDSQRALDTARKALALLPPVPAGKPVPELRSQIQAFQAHLGHSEGRGQ
jgi:serine/threonine protein kinase